MEQFSNLIEFRQAIYEHALTKARDAQFELLDALLLSPPIRAFPELSLSPVFRRSWSSAYAAIENRHQKGIGGAHGRPRQQKGQASQDSSLEKNSPLAYR